MATNSRLFSFFLAAVLFFGLSYIHAQSAGYYVETEGGQPRFIQRLAWSGGEYALRYEVIIENESGGTYRGFHREFTTELHIDISLQHGNYRFRVIPYDILNRPGNASEWKYIEVLPALKPEPFAAIPEFVEGGAAASGFILNITGYNFDPRAEIFIRRADGSRIAAETLDSGSGSVTAFIKSDELTPGNYDVIVRNPGGLEAGIGGVSFLPPESDKKETAQVEPEILAIEDEEKRPERKIIFEPLKPVIVGAEAAFIPTFPIYGDSLYNDNIIFSFTVRTNFLFYIPIGIYIGPELTGLFYSANYGDSYAELIIDTYYDGYIEQDPSESESEGVPSSFSMMIGANLLVRKWFAGERAAISFRAGIDLGVLPGWVKQNYIKMDVSLLYRILNKIMIEGGVEYSHLLSDISGGFIRPWVGLGVQY